MKKIELSKDRRDAMAVSLQRVYATEFDETLSAFRADRLIDVYLEHLAPMIYNQAVQDVRAHLQIKLDDLDGEVYIPIED